ncbi:hypothetical protein IEO21_10479 [Rhodonia placenta]|uniref:Uncharacterized protein n=1 Tax=Rhodonia placenta TaxID=104341 RepID=A0A8H7NSI7_9APHY|nr:hypothetical protein IEO21_10479 [Postia placenta]
MQPSPLSHPRPSLFQRAISFLDVMSVRAERVSDFLFVEPTVWVNHYAPPRPLAVGQFLHLVRPGESAEQARNMAIIVATLAINQDWITFLIINEDELGEMRLAELWVPTEHTVRRRRAWLFRHVRREHLPANCLPDERWPTNYTPLLHRAVPPNLPTMESHSNASTSNEGSAAH